MLSLAQLDEWAEFYALEPWGFEIQDALHARVSSVIARCAGAKDVKPSDFMIGDPAPAREPTPQETMAALEAAFGKRPGPRKG